MEKAEVLRVVVASPDDVRAERDAVEGVVSSVNRGVAAERNLVLRVSRWEKDAFPGFHGGGPQALIDAILRIPECDIFIGILWTRYGTPVPNALSGTEHEFKAAYESWKRKGAPQIFFYFNEKPYSARTKEETDQWGLVLDFKKNFPKEGLWWPYKSKEKFKELLRNHLELWLRQQYPLKAERSPATPADPTRYLQNLCDQTSHIDLRGLKMESGEAVRLGIDELYITLTTTLPDELSGSKRGRREAPSDLEPRASARIKLEDALKHRLLVVVGDPGSGKTTFLRRLAFILCKAQLSHFACATREPMKSAVGIEQRIPPGMGPGEFDCCLHAFTAGASEEDLRQASARRPAQSFTKLTGALIRHCLKHGRTASLQFVAKRSNYGGMIVTDVVNAIAGKKVKNAPAISGEQLRTQTALIANIHVQQIQQPDPLWIDVFGVKRAGHRLKRGRRHPHPMVKEERSPKAHETLCFCPSGSTPGSAMLRSASLVAHVGVWRACATGWRSRCTACRRP